MDLDGGFAQTEFGGDLLVRKAGDDALEDLTLARRQRLETNLEIRKSRAGASPVAVKVDCAANGVEQVLVPKRLGQKLDRAPFMAWTAIGTSP